MCPDTKNPGFVKPQKVFLETWGCQMNVSDSERMLGELLRDGQYVVTHNEKEADLVILNTCTIREKAKQKVMSRLGIWQVIKKTENPGLKIVLAGCLPEYEGEEFINSLPSVNIMIGPGQIGKLPALLKEISKAPWKKISKTGFSDLEEKIVNQTWTDFDDLVPPTLSGEKEVSRFIEIVSGCRNYCSYCVVPYTRGPVVSKRPEEIKKEALKFVANGAKEVFLLGQNVNSYGLDLKSKEIKTSTTNPNPFVSLLRDLTAIPDLARIRFTTSNPFDFTRDLADLFTTEQKMGAYIHLPLQSGSDRILSLMNRKITAAEYLERISWLKAARPDIAISTDIITGFPGEMEQDFLDTLDILKKIQFSFIYSFKYSPRPGTKAASFTEQISENEKERRLSLINKLQNEITENQNKAEIGRTREVLFLYASNKTKGAFYGRTEHYRLVRVFAKDDIIGKILPIKITAANKTALLGELL